MFVAQVLIKVLVESIPGHDHVVLFDVESDGLGDRLFWGTFV